MITQIIALFFPAIITVEIISEKGKNKMTLLQIISRLCSYAMVINVLVMFVIAFVLNRNTIINSLESFRFFILYVILASFCAVFIGIIEMQIRKRILGK